MRDTDSSHLVIRLRAVAFASVLAVLASTMVVASGASAAAEACAAGQNTVACENSKPGSPSSEWDIAGAGDESIQGFSTDISVDLGHRVDFKIDTDASAYTIDVYRLGWYDGDGARKVATLTPSAPLPQQQPACASDPSTLLYDCGTWAVSASWDVPSDAVSGVYVARPARADTGGASHIPFVVRDSTSTSDIVFQTSDTTWHAYNRYGGANLYNGANGRAVKVSYNRPITTRGDVEGRDYLFANEYPMIRFLERNGYDMSYISGIDTDRHGDLLTNHRTFLSVGHDEYWSGAQRANVEAARDQGVNLAFFAGNEVYWRTRYEPSIDGTSTDYRTLVCYKETWSGAKTDPSAEWTGTWRDPRFSGGGGRPENELVGTAYMVNDADLAIKVPAAEGRLRFWRDTAVADQAPGSVATLAPHTLGYESNEDLDNGFRPAGLVRLSETVGDVPEYLQDYGQVVAPGTTTHHLTTYRAPSGALVFSAGTIQWAWGLDTYHDGVVAPVDRSMQQATVNLMADMGAVADTLMDVLTVPQPSTDETPAAATITAPAAGTTMQNGDQVIVTGTASDVGGRVAAVEVSLDGGDTWHPATGRESWSYEGVVHGQGEVELLARATDDSFNLQPDPTSVAVAVSCPCTLFGNEVPSGPPAADTSATELGVRVVVEESGWIEAVRFYRGAAGGDSFPVTLWSEDGSVLASATAGPVTAAGWVTVPLPAPVRVTPGTEVVASYHAPQGGYSFEPGRFYSPGVLAPPLRAPASVATEGNGVYKSGRGFPTNSYQASSYWVDVVFTDVDSIAPTVSTQTPLAGSSSVPVATPVTVELSEPVDPGSVELTVSSGAAMAAVAGTTVVEESRSTVRFTPASPLSEGTTYTVSVTATDLADNPMVPATWTFRTVQPDPEPGVCPCSVWPDSYRPTLETSDDGASVELGLRFVTEHDGEVVGVRFFKGVGNTGTHTGSLWSDGGALLARATFTDESSTGWQQVQFDQPVTVEAGVPYVVSYRAPHGGYSYDAALLEAGEVVRSPLTAMWRGGRYTYGAGFPAQGSSTSYAVDVVFTPAPGGPVVGRTVPQDGASSVPSDQVLSALLDSPIRPGEGEVTLESGDGDVVPGTTSVVASSRTVTFTPEVGLSASTTYQATLTEVRSTTGDVLAPYTWSFTTTGTCPCSLFETSTRPVVEDTGDTEAVELGVRVVPDVAGSVSAVRFYQAGRAPGAYEATLWSAGGDALAVGQVQVDAAGWHEAEFAEPVQVTPGQVYVASYLAPSGRYPVTKSTFATPVSNGPLSSAPGANGVYRYGGGFPTQGAPNASSYLVDVVFVAGEAPPVVEGVRVSGVDPVAGAGTVPVDRPVTVSLSEPVLPSQVAIGLSSGGAAVPGTVEAVDAQTVRFVPAAALAPSTQYQASVNVSAVAGGPPSDELAWSFMTASAPGTPGQCPCSVWDDGTVPAVASVDDPGSVELGMRFSLDAPVRATAVRFYRGPANSAPQSVSLWSQSGDLLATAPATGLSSSGWQTVALATPALLSTGQTYTVSYRAGQGGYSYSASTFASGSVVVPPLYADGAVYTYGSGAPTAQSGANYWVDVVVERVTG
ncbi:DUF4082 domain-containing protein [Aquipuribacter sp. MA13-6]|uniref:DUF4082 domain-containing protein n=1 Tax=unclassified Aquipuribacter TaxID=2635084 RepID=UPI003EE9903C